MHDWLSSFFEARGLQKPDGRALYAYRLPDEEFRNLEDVLKRELAHSRGATGMATALFVLYAAEWWRRRYTGGRWSWKPIFHDLGLAWAAWSEVQRNQAVREGLRFWGRSVLPTVGLTYLGSIAVEGGLPLDAMARAQGAIGQLLARVLQVAARRADVGMEELRTWVESLEKRLPQSYRQREIHELLAQVIAIILDLNRQLASWQGGFGGGEPENPVDVLDRHAPGWRERFPLPLENEQARALLEQLVRDAVRIRQETPAGVEIRVRRRLVPVEPDGDAWRLESLLELPESLKLGDLQRVFGVPDADLPRRCSLLLGAGGEEFEIPLYRRYGGDAWTVDAEGVPGFHGIPAAAQHRLELVLSDGRTWSIVPAGGEELDAQLPWTFSMDFDEGFWVLEGAGRVEPTLVWVALAPGWNPETALEARGTLVDFGRSLWRLAGQAKFGTADGDVLTIQTGQAAADGFEWRGRRCSWGFSSPSRVFLGIPQLWHTGVGAKAKPVDPKLLSPDFSPAAFSYGPVTVSYYSGGPKKELLHRTRMLVLPQEARPELQAHGPASGVIRLAGWKAVSAVLRMPDVQAQVSRKGDDLEIGVSVPKGHQTPEALDVEVFWGVQGAPARLRVPFPAEGCRMFAGRDREIASGESLPLERLAQARLQILAAKPSDRVTLQMSMGGFSLPETVLKNLNPSAVFEVRLHEATRMVDQLLSLDFSRKAQVAARVRIAEREVFHVSIGRFAGELAKDGVAGIRMNPFPGMADPQGVNRILAWNLGDLAQPPLEMAGTWDENARCMRFPFRAPEPGSWFFYAPRDCPQVQPLTWNLGQTPGAQGLQAAMQEPGKKEREKRLEEIIGDMAGDFSHPDWETLLALARETGHVPLVGLDVWKLFAMNGAAMAALFFRLGVDGGFLRRFARELPFAWETVTYSQWISALKRLEAWWKEAMGGAYRESLRIHLQGRIGAMQVIPHMVFLLGMLAAELWAESSGADSEEARQLQLLGCLHFQNRQRLLEGEDSFLMAFFQRHAEEEWPKCGDWNDYREAVRAQVKEKGCELQLPVRCPHHHQEWLVNLPLLLAWQGMCGNMDSWFADYRRVHWIRLAKSFDYNWFETAFCTMVQICRGCPRWNSSGDGKCRT